jgi:murein DD-endopeptidase MepM/ murein hydrolase activator NlpD
MKTSLLIKHVLAFMCLAGILAACAPVINLPAETATPVSPTATTAPSATPTPQGPPTGYVEYLTQSGDTLLVISKRFGVNPDQIISDAVLPADKLIDPGTRLFVRDLLGETSRPDRLIPDSDFVYSPSAIGFDIQSFIGSQPGYLKDYTELMTRGMTSAADILSELAIGHSINPRLLLTLIEYESGWVTRQPVTTKEKVYPMGWEKADRAGIYFQTGLLIRQLAQGYYNWRAGMLTDLTFLDGSTLRLSPQLNAGTVGLMYALAQYHDRASWEAALYGPDSIAEVHTRLFGDAWARAAAVEPLFPAGTDQPQMNLPIPVNQKWALTNGPHPAWGLYGPPAALDFAPAGAAGCDVSRRFATAAAAGKVVRAGHGAVVLDLDGDGYEQTGWVLVYMHLANSERAQLGDVVAQDAPLGHPSCEGGNANGAHVHIARKFNGEWVLADGALPFTLSGYRTHRSVGDCTGDRYCGGYLENGERTITANPVGNAGTITIRPESEPRFFFTPTPKK